MSLLLFVFCSIGRSWGNDFYPFMVTPESVRDRMQDPEHGSGFDYQYQYLKFRSVRPGRRVVVGASAELEWAMGYFAEVLHEQFGVTLVLASRLDKWSTPIFSGFVLDRDERVIANFKLLSARDDHETFVSTARDAAAKIERYSADPSRFARLAFRNLREAFGFERDDDVDEIWIGTRTMRNRYWKIVNRVKRVAQLFEPGRPTWLLADLDSSDHFLRGEADSLRRLTGGDRYLRRVLLRQPDRLIVIQDGHSAVYRPDTCEIDLTIP